MKAVKAKKIIVDAGPVHAELIPPRRVQMSGEYAAVVTIKPRNGTARFFRVSKNALTQVVGVVNEDWLK